MLIDNKIENEDGLPFFIKDGHVKTKLLNPSTGYFKDTQMNKPDLLRILIDANKKGLIKKPNIITIKHNKKPDLPVCLMVCDKKIHAKLDKFELTKF